MQIAFNFKKGSLPIRKDVDLDAANDCVKKGLAILEAGGTVTSQIETLTSKFFVVTSMTPEMAQERFASLIADAY